MPSHLPTFPDEEYAARVQRVRESMEERRLDACLFSVPESICYLTGLNHWGYFGLHVLVVPRDGPLCLIARAMDRVTMETQLAADVEFRGYRDNESPARLVADVLKERRLHKARVGMDFDTIYRSYAATKALMDALPKVRWVDSQDAVDRLRFVKSPLEVAAMRQAATVSDRMMEAAIRATVPGANERAIAAEVFKEMVLAGGEPPSFGPFIRPSARLGEEHGTWGNQFLAPDDTLFVELAGCYQRYHAPMGRFVYLNPPQGSEPVQAVCLQAFQAVTEAMRPGVTAHDVYRSWQQVVDDAGLSDYKRHHAGYMVGMSFPRPGWRARTAPRTGCVRGATSSSRSA